MARRTRIILGLNSGTSADGIDAVACEITGRGLSMRPRVLLHVHRRYPAALRERILAVMAPAQTRTEEICRLQTDIGSAFGRVAVAAIKKLGKRRVDLIGSHGQTVCHLPPSGPPARRSRPDKGAKRGHESKRGDRDSVGTLQLGDPAIIAARTGAAVVSGFRQADMAVGGQGAPLVPWTDLVLFRHRTRSRVIQNIGGIANLSWLPAGGGADDVIAFDAGPGNMVIDALVRRFTQGREQFDRGGRRAASAEFDEGIVRRLSRHAFIARPPPKSCGREEFGEAFCRDLLRRHHGARLTHDAWIATATEWVARGLCASYAAFLPLEKPHCGRLDEVILCGGGARNKTLVQRLSGLLAACFEGVDVRTTEDYDIPLLAKEGLSFAMLAAACVDRVPANLPQVTGARRSVVLGQVCQP